MKQSAFLSKFGPPSKDLSDKEFVKYVEKKVKATIKEYALLKDGEKVVVAVSGGKDSSAILYMLHKWGVPAEAFTVDVHIGKYTQQNLENIRSFCMSLRVKLHEVSFKERFGLPLCYLQAMLKGKGVELNSCTTCGVLRRYLLNQNIRALKSTVVVTGHNLDDECQQVMMNIIHNTPDLSARMGPAPGLARSELFIPRVKPLYFVTNSEVERYSKIHKFPVEYGECPCSRDAFRRAVKYWLNDLTKKDPLTKYNLIWRFLETLPGLQNKFKNLGTHGICPRCGEASSGAVCKACQIIGMIKEPSKIACSKTA